MDRKMYKVDTPRNRGIVTVTSVHSPRSASPYFSAYPSISALSASTYCVASHNRARRVLKFQLFVINHTIRLHSRLLPLLQQPLTLPYHRLSNLHRPMTPPPLLQQPHLPLQRLNLILLLILHVIRLQRQPTIVKDLEAEESQRQGFQERSTVALVEVAVCGWVGAFLGEEWWVVEETGWGG